jgi:hypothetical protein
LADTQVRVVAPPGKRVEHQGIKIELLGQIELFVDRGSYYDFISLGPLPRRQTPRPASQSLQLRREHPPVGVS